MMEDIKISYEEKEKFQKAFRQHEFRVLFDEYFDEISDEKYRKEKEDYLLSLYFKGELKKDQILIKPNEVFCVKTKILYSNQMNQNLFINICTHQGIYSISFEDLSVGKICIPYSLSQIRPDKQGDNICCLTVDCCVNPSTVDAIRAYNEVLNFLLENVCQCIEQNFMKDNEKICRDFKILNDIICKGDKPFLLCINKNSIIKNVLIEEEKKLDKLKKEFEDKEIITTENDVNQLLNKSKIKTEIKNSMEDDENNIIKPDEKDSNSYEKEDMKKIEKKKYYIYHQGSLNTSSFFKLKEYEHISLNLPNKIKILINTDNYIKKKDIKIDIKEKKMEVMFNNVEENLIIDLPYPCDSKDYLCILKNKKKIVEIYLNLCKEFVKSYTEKLYKEHVYKEVDEKKEDSDSLDYIDDLVKGYEAAQNQKEEIKNSGKSSENISLNCAKSLSENEQDIPIEPSTCTDNVVVNTANNCLDFDEKKDIFNFNIDEKVNKDYINKPSDIEPCASDENNKKEKKIYLKDINNDENDIDECNVDLSNSPNYQNDKNNTKDAENDCTLKNLKIEMVHDRKGYILNECNNKADYIMKKDKDEREKENFIFEFNEQELLNDVNMHDNMSKDTFFSCILWAAYI
ncbi:PIH1 domain-containing protein, putative [Plasmodium vinckei vinckei]|uniref:PIH1 domain-containing protein, putative n=1 Tax=Plasmodium vinckei vinckei TaxID=54757 RepID=A0A449BRQ3_PLAVN|nr:PIH1 domain-containing protein, putative [Plasmodium vinckei vinckei]VEV56140.1 PIH1 domain-containing protein, putative [Plasmodium vinckei vinckei]